MFPHLSFSSSVIPSTSRLFPYPLCFGCSHNRPRFLGPAPRSILTEGWIVAVLACSLFRHCWVSTIGCLASSAAFPPCPLDFPTIPMPLSGSSVLAIDNVEEKAGTRAPRVSLWMECILANFAVCFLCTQTAHSELILIRRHSKCRRCPRLPEHA